jgi:HAD superfamily hydrolase (TIGR01490 family)
LNVFRYIFMSVLSFLGISAFDLDRTLFRENSSFRFGVYLYRQKIIPLRSLVFILTCNLRFTLGLLSIQSLHQTAFDRLFRGKALSLVQKWAEDFVESNFESLIYQPACEKLRQAQRSGHMTAILSSSPAFLVEPIAKRFGVSVWQSTEYAVDENQNFCRISKLVLGEDKALFIEGLLKRQGLSKYNVTAYSDSYHDLAFLECAGTPIGVNPDRKLRSICLNKNWTII